MHKFELFKSKRNSQWYFRMIARNGNIVASSEGYKRRADCARAVTNIKDKAAVAAVVIQEEVVKKQPPAKPKAPAVMPKGGKGASKGGKGR